MKDKRVMGRGSSLVNVKVSELIGVDHRTVWMWIIKKKDIYSER